MLHDGPDRLCDGFRHRDGWARAAKGRNAGSLPLSCRALLYAPSLPTQPPNFGGGAGLFGAPSNGSRLDCNPVDTVAYPPVLGMLWRTRLGAPGRQASADFPGGFRRPPEGSVNLPRHRRTT